MGYKTLKSNRLAAAVLAAALLMLLALLLPATARAAADGDFTYTVSEDAATITKYTGTGGAVTIPDTLGGYPVTAIGSRAFERCTKLSAITIPGTVTAIGNHAFWGCYNLKSVTITDPVAWCKVQFGNEYSNPMSYADKLSVLDALGQEVTKLVLDNTVKTIPASAFRKCTGLTSVTIPEGVTAIGSRAFERCINLTSVTIPGSVAVIEAFAFDSCTALTGLTIPKGVKTIGATAFYNCTGLTSVTIPDSVTTIGESAFENCTGLTELNIPNSVTSVGSSAFSGCTGLLSVTIPSSLKTIECFYNCTGLTAAIIPEGVTTVAFAAFYNCTGLTSVTIPASVTDIHDWAFRDCAGIQDVYYAGTQSQWEALNVGSWNSALTDATIHFEHVHDYTKTQPFVVPATCEETGSVDYVCVHGETYRKILPALGHMTGNDGRFVEPTCTEQGYTLSTCSRCDRLGKTLFVPALGHTFKGAETVSEPTCTEQGYTAVQCIRCQETEKKQFTDPLGHELTVVPGTAPTCTEAGLSDGAVCRKCGFVETEQKPIAALGHSYENGTCTVCGALDVVDFTGDGLTTDADAVYLLRYTLFPEDYPLAMNGDVNNDGQITDADAVYLLRYSLFPEDYPLYPEKNR